MSVQHIKTVQSTCGKLVLLQYHLSSWHTFSRCFLFHFATLVLTTNSSSLYTVTAGDFWQLSPLPPPRGKLGTWVAGAGDSMGTWLLSCAESDTADEQAVGRWPWPQDREQRKPLWEPPVFSHSKPGFRRVCKLLTQSTHFLAWLHRVTIAELEDIGRKRWIKPSYWMKAPLPTQCSDLWLNHRFRQKFTLTTQLERRSFSNIDFRQAAVAHRRKLQSPHT